MNFVIFKPQIPNKISHQSSCRLPNTRSSNARWADCDTSSARHPCTAQRSLPSSQSSTPGILGGALLCNLIIADFTLNIAALLWELHWTFKATHIVAFFAFFSAAAFAELKCALLKRFLRVQIISILFLDTLQGSSTHRSSSSHGYDHNSVQPAFWSKNRPPHPDPWNQWPRWP